MRKIMLIAAVAALSACQQKAAEPANDANMAAANASMANDMATPAAFEIKGTSWEYTDNKTKKPIQESIDENGNYVAQSGKEHIDHGTAVMKDGKACFTSKMDKEGEVCWTTSPVDVGGTMDTVSDKGEKLTVKRVAYVAPPPMK